MNLGFKKKLPYLIYDSCHENVIGKIINIKKANILNFRKNQNKFVNALYFMPSFIRILTNIKLIKILLLEGIFVAYVCDCIKKYKPRYVLTTTDNDLRFYKLKKYNKKVKFVSIQNGLRSKFHDIFEKLDTKQKLKLSADYYCVYNDHLKEIITKFIDTKVITIGSYISNTLKIKKKIKNKKNILYISSFRDSNPNQIFDRFQNGKIMYMKDLMSYEINLITKLHKFCEDKKYKLSIAGCSIENYKKEKKYYKKLLPHGEWEFFRKKNIFDSYKLLDKFNIVVSCGSSMGVEAIGRNCKVAFFGRDFSIYNDWLYGWPQKTKKKGFFYTNLINDKEIKRIMSNLIQIQQASWGKIVKKESKRVMKYDYKNNILKGILKLK